VIEESVGLYAKRRRKNERGRREEWRENRGNRGAEDKKKEKFGLKEKRRVWGYI